MPQKQNPAPLVGSGSRADIQHANVVDSARINDASQGALAVIRKNVLEEIRVELSEYNGHNLLNVRIWTEPRVGGVERIPTRAGIACNVRLLPELIEALHKAEAAARKAGLL